MIVKVKGPYSVDYRGRLYKPGEKVDMAKQEAERLIQKGIVEEVKPEKEQDKKE